MGEYNITLWLILGNFVLVVILFARLVVRLIYFFSLYFAAVQQLLTCLKVVGEVRIL